MLSLACVFNNLVSREKCNKEILNNFDLGQNINFGELTKSLKLML